MKKVSAAILILVMTVSFVGCGSSSVVDESSSHSKKLQTFYYTVTESQELLDQVADAIYRNWYDAIYNDEFGESIDLAIAYAFNDNKEEVDRIKELDAEIADAFKDVKDGERSELVKDIMSAYSDYYEFVINVSGSFNSYSADKETLKKELAGLLRELSYEFGTSKNPSPDGWTRIFFTY